MSNEESERLMNELLEQEFACMQMKAPKQPKGAKVKVKAQPEPAQPEPSPAPVQSRLEAEAEPDDPICKLCVGEPASVTFEPCKHKICCLDCAYRIRKCTKCNAMVTKKIKEDGQQLIAPGDVKVSELLAKVKELEDEDKCKICLEIKNEIFFNCGHRTCAKCSVPLKECPFCRIKIKKRTKIF